MVPELIVEKLKSIRIDLVEYESQVVAEVKKVLEEHGVGYISERRLGRGCRVDLFTDDGVAIEVKKGKPNTRRVEDQIRRYASFDEVKSVVLVSERGLRHHISEAHGKNIFYVAISKNWGISL